MHAASLVILTLCIYAPAPRERTAEKGPDSIERKLHGPWRSESACGGTITFRADGTYEHKFQGPGGDTSSGTWVLRWDALPPTLVLTCKVSADPAKVGVREAKLEGLNANNLAITYTNGGKANFARVKKESGVEVSRPAP